MGRFGDLFKKSDGKSKAENPYAQPPVDQSSPPPQYGQYNQSQYNDNRYATQQTQGPPSGLPAGPRPGGLPSRVAPGPSRTDTWESNRTAGTAPPQYSEQTSPPPPSYHGSPGTFSGGKSPAFSSNTASPSFAGASPALSSNTASPSLGGQSPALSSNKASPSLGGGFPREKYGAQDGFGRNRFEPSNTSPYDRSAAFPSQRQGGYGGLDTESGGLFANYQPPSQRAPGPSQVQGDPSSAVPGQYGDSQMMTEEEEVNWKKNQIVETTRETRDVARRIKESSNMFLQGVYAVAEQTHDQGRVLTEAEKKTMSAGVEISKGKVNLTNLDHAQGMWNFAGNSKTAVQSREERKLMFERDNEVELRGIEREEQEAAQRKAALHARLESQQQNRSKGLLGGNKAGSSMFEFEDDTGEQREMNNEIEEAQEEALFALQQARLVLDANQKEIERQNHQVQRMTERVERSKDSLWQNHVHLQTKYLK